ncbi:MAG: MmgE/PrpD family protein [Pseudomonadota bacterium]
MPDTLQSSPDALTRLATFAAETPARDIPAETLAKTALILADSVGAIAGGAAESDVQALTVAQLAPGSAIVIGAGQRRAPGVAALLNGTAGTTLEMDEGNQFSKGHPGMHTIPAVLAVADPMISGRDLLAAIALGYETGARIGTASALRPTMHPHGTWGTLCAASAVARLRGADARAMRQALNMAASLSLATSRRTMLEGGTVRNLYTGMANQTGVLVGDLLASGYSGDTEGVSQVFGQVVSDGFAEEALTDQLGTRWEVDRNYFKMHACCRFNHAALDALAQLTEAEPIAPDAVTRITVETYALAAELSDPAPANMLAGKFSLPFAIATALVNGSTGVESFTAAQVARPDIRALAAKVDVVEDAALTAMLPAHRPARLAMMLTDGRTLHAATRTNRGDWADPYAPDEIHAKFLSLAQRSVSPAAARSLWDLALALPDAPTAQPFLEALSGGAGAPSSGATC